MADPKPVRRNPALFLAKLRQFHLYIGVFIAPSVLFFALTGIVQLFSLHEARGSYTPPALIEKLGNVHKDQVFEARKKRPPPPKPPTAAAAPAAKPAAAPQPKEALPKVSTYLLKWFFTFVALGLITSTVLGLWMALSFGRGKPLLWGLLAVGAAAPVLLLLM